MKQSSTAITTCPICQTHASEWGRLFDDRHGYPDSVAYSRCSICGIVFQPMSMDNDTIAELYSKYYPRSTFSENDWEPYTWTPGFSAWLAGRSSAYMYVPPRVRVLDVGCGFGHALGYHRERGCSVHGTEMDANAQRIAASQQMDIRQGPFSPDEWEVGSFDYVTLDQVVEHSYTPLALLSDVHKVLKPEGRLLLTTPNAGSLSAKLLRRNWIHWHPPYHVILYTSRAIKILLERTGYSVEWIKTVTPSAWMYYQLLHCGLKKVQGQPTPFWDPRASREYCSKERKFFKLANKLDRLHAFSVLTRMLDFAGAGDNLLVCAKPLRRHAS